MLTPGKLRDVIASSLDLDARSVDVHLRNLREAGLISKEKRGRGAAQVTAADAAALLVAVMGSQFVKDTVRTHEDYGQLKLKDRRLSLHRGNTRLKAAFKERLPIGNPKSSQTLLDVLSAILGSLDDRSFFPYLSPEDFTKRELARTRYEPFLWIRFFAPIKAVTVEWGGYPVFSDARLYGDFPARREGWDSRMLGSQFRMITMRSVGLVSAANIAKALRTEIGTGHSGHHRNA